MPGGNTAEAPDSGFSFSSEAVREVLLVLFDALYDLKKAPLDREEMRSVIEEAALTQGDPFHLAVHLGMPPRRRLFFLALSDLLARGLLERSLDGYSLTDEAVEEVTSRSRDERGLARKAAEAVIEPAA
jgi:hypothetical protein